MKEKKNHLYFDNEERKLLIDSLVELKNQLIIPSAILTASCLFVLSQSPLPFV